ncbi:MAG: YitT family protein [Bacteroidota bacterium]|nr:YitT family protein [Bacteroidota bacterium]
MAKEVRLFAEVRAYSIITLGVFINAIAWMGFMIPSHIVGGGINGISSLLYLSTGIPVAVGILIFNTILIILAIRILGVGFGIKSIFSILMMVGAFSLLQYFIHEPIVKDRFMAAIIGGILNGVSIGIVFTQGGSTGGVDIIAMIINKYRNITPGKVILYFDVCVITSSYLIYQHIENIVYGYVVMAIGSYVVDLVLTGANQTVQIFIFSQKNELIADTVVNELKRGVTLVKGTGWYSKSEQDILMILMRKTELPYFFRAVKAIDANAFMSVSSVMGVYGQGFDVIKVR